VELKTATDPQSDAGVRSRLRSLEVDVEDIRDRMRASATKPEGAFPIAVDALHDDLERLHDRVSTVEGYTDNLRERIRGLEVADNKQMTASAAPVAKLRAATAEALLAGGLLLADVSRTMTTWSADAPAKASEERFRKAMEMLREALS
jgi:hypothetical protein